MKVFFSASAVLPAREFTGVASIDQGIDRPIESPAGNALDPRDEGPLQGRVAVYDSDSAAPRVLDVSALEANEFIERLSAETYSLARDRGGDLPYTVIREIAENLIHARFREPVVSVMDDGQQIRFADQGPGINDKERAVLPGYTTATADMKRVIRGVGSGLPIVREFLCSRGGRLEITDNLRGGTVVTVCAQGSASDIDQESAPVFEEEQSLPSAESFPRLTTRHQRVLSLVMECGEAGPSLVAKELAVGLSTAYRDLAFLESRGLITSDSIGKRQLTTLGARYLDAVFG